MRVSRGTRPRRYLDTGSVTIEVAILVPGLFALLGLGVVAGRFEVAAGAVESASAAAARAASLARSSTSAQDAARSAATGALDGEDLHCGALTVSVDTSAFARPDGARSGQPAQVAATLTCQLDLGDLLIPGIPGTRTITSRATSVLDAYRASS